MPKANGKDAFYFPHDCNARNDNKILSMRSVYGAEGYGLYFMVIEILREQPNYKYPLGKFAFKSLAMELHCEAEKLESFVLDCCVDFADDNSSLLNMDENYLWSDSLLRRMKCVDDVSELRRSAARKRWDSKDDANALHKLSKIEQSKAKQSKADQSKAEESKCAQAHAAAADCGDDFSGLLEEYRSKIGRKPTDSQRALLKAYVDELGAEVVGKALSKAEAQGGQSWSYVNTILQSWLTKGVNTPELVMEEQARFKAEKCSGRTNGPVVSEEQRAAATRKDVEWMRKFLKKEKQEAAP